MANRKGHVISATYRITTPMFCSGADQTKAELRLPSFKGALRFWWRSLMWGKANVEELRQKEAAIFGSSDQDVGQSKVRMRIANRQLGNQINKGKVFQGGHLKGAHYLGYGVMEAFASRNKGTKAGELKRPMIPSGWFIVELWLSPSLDEATRQGIVNALIFLGTVGGLGSKSRKGYGSLTLTKLLQDEQIVELARSPAARLRNILCGLPDRQPGWTAWSKASRVVTATQANGSAIDLLDLIGREEVHFRSWGRTLDGKPKVLDKDSEKNFKADHDLSKGMDTSISYPARVAFGLPHNYGKRAQDEVAPASKDHDRRASPLFIHIHQVDSNEGPVAVLAFLPSQFLPDREQVRAFQKTVPLNDNESFWYPIHGLLDRLVGNNAQPPARPGYEQFPSDSKWRSKKTALEAKEVTLG